MRKRIYSQSGQDALADFLLKRNGLVPKIGPYVGSYIDVGACHPVDFNNTFYFYDKGWRGVCVEPNPDLIPTFSQHRQEDIFLSCAIGDRTEVKFLHRFTNPQWNTFDERRISKIQRRYEGRVTYLGSMEIKVKRLKDIIDELNIFSLDLLSVDVEGFEISVFRGMDFNSVRPKLIVFESILPIETAADDEVVKFLTSHQYRLVAHTGHDAFMLDTLALSK